MTTNMPTVECAAHAHAVVHRRRAEDTVTNTTTLPITHDPDDAPRIGESYAHEGRERVIVDRAFSDDGRTLTLWFEEAT